MTKENIKQIGAYIQFNRDFYEQQGSGLGLAIVKKIAELHKFDFQIKSIQNEFTEVIISINM